MIACLSPNGGTRAQGDAPLMSFMIATLAGIYTLRRESLAGDWKIAATAMDGKHISCILHEPRSGKLFAGVHGGGGLWVSDDEGSNWRQLTEGLVHPHVYTVAAQYRADKTVLFAGVEPAALFRSDDLGESWYELPALREVPGTEKWIFPPPPHIAHVKHIAFHDSDPETLYVSVEQGGVFRTTDDGKSWTELLTYLSSTDKFYRDTHRVLIRQDDPDSIFMATGDGLYATDNAGKTWDHLTTRHDRVGYPDAMFLDPRNEDNLYVAGSCDAPEDWREEKMSHAAVVHSSDRGKTWRTLKNGFAVPMVGNIEAMGMYHWDNQLAFTAGTATGEVYFSEDAGETWACIMENLPPISKAGHYRWFMTEEQRKAVEQGMREWKNV